MGVADVILTLKITRSIDGIILSQSHYVKKTLERFGYTKCRPIKISYDSLKPLFKNENRIPV